MIPCLEAWNECLTQHATSPGDQQFHGAHLSSD
jgi:hypothetical protein